MGQCFVVTEPLKCRPPVGSIGGNWMTTVTYDVVVSMTVEVDAEDLIEDSARALIEMSIDDIGQADIHEIEISCA